MPAKSENQRIAAAIALHGNPKAGSAAAQMKKSMSQEELHKFAVKPNHYAKGLREYKR